MNAIGAEGMAPLAFAIAHAPLIFAAIRGGFAAGVDTLIARGADIKLLDSEGRTRLMVAVGERQWKTARSLLTTAVDRTIQAHDGSTLASILERTSVNAQNDSEFTAFMAELAARATGTP